MAFQSPLWCAALIATLAFAQARASDGSDAPGPQGFHWAMPAWTPAPPVPEDNPKRPTSGPF